MFTDIQWGVRLAPNTISEVAREICQSMVDEFKDKFIVTPNTEVQWHSVAEAFHQQLNFQLVLGLINGKHLDYLEATP